MGYYTGLRCKLIIKKEYREVIDKLCNLDNDLEWSDIENEIIINYSKDPRANFIPFGAIDIYKPTWDELNDYGFELNFNKDSGLWTFECSLKDHNDTIYKFISYVLPEICEKSYHIEKLAESWDASSLFEIIDGKLVTLPNQIWYDYAYRTPDNNHIHYSDYDFNLPIEDIK